MIDQELIGEIRRTSDSLRTVYELNEEESISLTNKIASKFIDDKSKDWWWESLLSKPFIVEYGEKDGIKILENIISKDQLVFLFITDDEPGPWNVFRGDFSEISDILKDQRFFEYFIVPAEIEWMVFDTHHNSLIIAGSLIEQIKAKN